MTAANTFVTVTDPDLLRAGSSPYAPFAARYIQLYRYTTEALARANSSGTLVTTFTLVASSTAAADPNIAGPFRYGYYDASQGAGSWYRYRFADSGVSTFSSLSEPWEADNRAQLTLRDIIYEALMLLDACKRGTASAGSTTTLTCAALFTSTARAASVYENWWMLLSQDAGGAGAAPEGEWALLDSINTSTGVATLERALTAIASGDIFILNPLLPPDEIIHLVNEVREKMAFTVEVDIALSATEDRYPAPYGVLSETDVIDAVGITQYANSNREEEFPIDFRVVFDGITAWIEITENPGSTPVARFTVLRNYRDLEGALALMADTTSAPLQWIRPALAYAIADHLLGEDENDPDMTRLKQRMEDKASSATARFAPDVTRRAKRGAGRRIMPGPAWVA